MSLYTSDITRIDWNDVVAFCQERIQENATLDYKENFPARLENSIAAMANSFGGLILIGVAEDNDSRPICPPAGIPFERGLPERVTNIVATNITPPVFPDVAVCTTEVGNRALLVLRVPQSHMAPMLSATTHVCTYGRETSINQRKWPISISCIG